MRKLDKKNKLFITALSAFVILVFIGLSIFIVYKIGQTSIKYNVKNNSYVYNNAGELININEDGYVKKNLTDKYILYTGDEKINIGSNPAIFNQSIRELKLLGTFYEVSKNGEVAKIKGENDINTNGSSKLYKISDRRYLVVSPNIKSEDGSLNTTDYLLINIDKVGNSYLYNNKINIKTFSDLKIVTDGFTFNVNEEKLVIENEVIDLAKINGSTNTYTKPADEGEGEGDGEGEGGGSGNGSGSGEGENIYPEPEKIIETETVTVNKYIARKTTIMNIESTTSEISVNYIVYDPFSEYTEVYANLYQNGNFIKKFTLQEALTNLKITGLNVNKEYRLDFHYSYNDADGNPKDNLFDTAYVTTKNINANISLEKTSQSVVRYILKVDKYTLDSATVSMYIDGVKVASDEVNTALAATSGGFAGSINYEGSGDFVILKLENCIYNGEKIEIDASYKYKI